MRRMIPIASALAMLCCLIVWPLPGFAAFTNGQNGSIVLGAPGFNNAGYLNTPGDGLLFNHPMNISTDGTHLLLADTRNNRILIWNSLPEGNISPDVVLGQDNLTNNNPGTTLNRFNWPVGVSAAAGKVVVSDTYNHRILVWNSFPTSNGRPADLYINNLPPAVPGPQSGFSGAWPWSVWTDGAKLIVCATQAKQVLIWNTFPTVNNQAPDIVLNGKNPTDGTYSFGTPRSIGTDGQTYLVIGDHNAYVSNAMGNFFWRSFPSINDQPYDFFMTNPPGPYSMMWGGQTTAAGKFVIIAPPYLGIWNSLPASASAPPDLLVGRDAATTLDDICKSNGYYFNDGDGSHLAITPSGKVYISLYNSNKVVGYRSLPTVPSQCPDFAIGSPNINTNTYYSAGMMNNPMPASDGKCLIAVAGFDYKLQVWLNLPTQSSTPPDFSYDLSANLNPFQPSVNALFGTTFVMAGGPRQQVWIWKTLPPDGNHPDLVFLDKIGTQIFQNINGVALDNSYLYISDNGNIYVWPALPTASTPPLFSLNLPQAGKISSDGRYLGVCDGQHWTVNLYQVSTLSAASTPVATLPAVGASYQFIGAPGPTNVHLAHNHLFIADDVAGRVLVWNSVDRAIAGHDPDAVLGQPDLQQGLTDAIGINRLFWPLGLAFAGNRLWVGEFKFSSRLVEFSTKNVTAAMLLLLLMD